MEEVLVRKLKKEVSALVRQLLRQKFGDSLPIELLITEELDGSETETHSEKSAQKQQPHKQQVPSKKQQRQDKTTNENEQLTYKEKRILAEERRKLTAGVCGCQLILYTSTVRHLNS